MYLHNAGFGDWMSDLVAKAQVSGGDITQKAEALGSKFTNWANDQESQIKKHAFKYFYTQGRVLLDQFGGNPQVAAFKKVAGDLYDTAVGGYNLIEKISQSDFGLDASGIVDTAMAANAMVNSLSPILKYAGANAKMVDSFGGWASVGIGCIGGIAAGVAAGSGSASTAGGLGGMVGCASSIFLQAMTNSPLQFLSILGESGHLQATPQRAVLALNTQNATAIQADALRLATVLKYYYGIGSTKVLWDRISSLSAAFYHQPVCDAQLRKGCNGWAQSYPTPPPVNMAGQIQGQASGPVTAATLGEIANMFTDEEIGTAPGSFGGGGGVGIMAGFYDGIPMREWGGADSLLTQGQSYSETFPRTRQIKGVNFLDYGDVSVSIAESRAAKGRAAVAGSGVCIHRGWVVVDELINFFAAVTLRQIEDSSAQSVRPIEEDYLHSGLPVQLLSVISDGGNPGRCWTTNRVSSGGCDINALILAVRSGNVEAAREFAGIRLMAAMSQLLMVYRWWGSDVIASVVVYPPSDFRYLLSAPVDPRTVIPSGSLAEGVTFYKVNQNDGINEGQSAGEPTAPISVSVWNYEAHQPTYIDVSFRSIGVWRNTFNGPHLGARRGPKEMAAMIAGREALFGSAKRAALLAAQDSTSSDMMRDSTSSDMMQSTAMQSSMMMTPMMQANPEMFQKKLIGSGEVAAGCVAEGGYYEESTGYCKPSAATEAVCRSTGGTPYWDPLYKYKCLAPGQAPPGVVGPGYTPEGEGGGEGGGAVLLVGAALLLWKLLKK
jgi:hypothetical protein